MKFNNLKVSIGLLICSLLNSFSIEAQSDVAAKTADKVINKVIKTLNAYTAFSYKFTRETKYHSDNYYNKHTAFIYMEQYLPSVIGLRYQTKGTEINTVFNGQ